jgi:hypothetical protein
VASKRRLCCATAVHCGDFDTHHRLGAELRGRGPDFDGLTGPVVGFLAERFDRDLAVRDVRNQLLLPQHAAGAAQYQHDLFFLRG